MKKNLIIGLLVIISLSSMTYGYFQKARADKQEALAMENAKVAREAEIKAAQNQKAAEMQRMIAITAMDRSEVALKALEEAKREK
ncbi:MAG: hypothetical protein KBF45_15665 [Cyclobacteriaceae bacterium]|jgi:hypothetical protein|nr:hypothetical protein [Cyclobacteriaceae bacterium]